MAIDYIEINVFLRSAKGSGSMIRLILKFFHIIEKKDNEKIAWTIRVKLLTGKILTNLGFISLGIFKKSHNFYMDKDICSCDISTYLTNMFELSNFSGVGCVILLMPC